MTKAKKICLCCKREFEPVLEWQTYCSDGCSLRAASEHYEQYEREVLEKGYFNEI